MLWAELPDRSGWHIFDTIYLADLTISFRFNTKKLPIESGRKFPI